MEKAEMKSQLLPVNELELPLDGSVMRRKSKCSCIPLTVNTVLCLITCVATLVCVTYASWAISEIGNAKKILDIERDGGMRKDGSNKQNPSQLQQFQRQITTNHSATKISGANGSGTHVERTESSQDVQENTDFGFDWTEHSTEEDDSDYKTVQDAASDGNEDTNDIDQDVEDTYEDEYDYYYTDLDDDSYRDVDYLKDEDIATENSYGDWDDNTSTDELYGSGDYGSDDEESAWKRVKRSVGKPKNSKESKETTDTKSKKSQRKRKEKKCKGKECKKGKKNRKEVIPRLAQYEATVSDETIVKKLPLYDKLVNKDGCDYMDEMKGILCRSKIFTPIDYEAPLHIFHPTDWVSAKKSPLKKVDGSANFEIKSDGVILVFSQVSFSTNRPTNGASIVQSRTSKGSHPHSNIIQELQCKQGIKDHITTSDHVTMLDNRMASDHRMTFGKKVSLSCSIVGLLAAKKGDILQIFSNYDGSSLDLNVGSTYFGVVQLTKG